MVGSTSEPTALPCSGRLAAALMAGLHMNDTGARIVADLLASMIRAHLPKHHERECVLKHAMFKPGGIPAGAPSARGADLRSGS